MQQSGLEAANWPDRRLVVAGLSGLLTGCLGGRTFRYRIGAEVAVNGRVARGDAVQSLYQRPPFPGLSGMDTGSRDTCGDAAMVDLGPRGILFLTLKGWHWRADVDGRRYVSPGEWTPLDALTRAFGPEQDEWAARIGERVPLLYEETPVMVTFDDLTDPRTVRWADPKNLAAAFGTGVSLISVFVEMTRDRVTQGIQRTLPWVNSLRSRTLSGQSTVTTNELVDNLYAWSFSIRNGND